MNPKLEYNHDRTRMIMHICWTQALAFSTKECIVKSFALGFAINNARKYVFQNRYLRKVNRSKKLTRDSTLENPLIKV